MKHPIKSVLLAGVAVMAMSGAASALTFGSIPNGQTNDGLGPLGLNNPLNGWYGAEIFLFGGPVDITVTVLGSEAGNSNSFSFGGTTYQDPAGGNSWAPNVIGDPTFATWTVNNVASGSLGFSFGTNGGLTVANGANPDNTVPAGFPGINFFASFVGNENGSSGQGVYLFFDDDGANNDDNHDDLVVRLDITNGSIGIVPLPASFLLLGTALGGIGLLGRRRKLA